MKKDSIKAAFLNALKSVTTCVPYSDTNPKAKRVIAIAIKESGLSVKDVLNYITGVCGISATFTEEEWKHILNYHKNWNGKLGKMLKNFKKVSQDEFSILAKGCGYDPEVILKDDKINEYGWLKALEILNKECKGLKVETKAEETAEVVPSAAEIKVATPAPETGKTTTKIKKIVVVKNEDGVAVGEFKMAKEAAEMMGCRPEPVRKRLMKNPVGNKFVDSKKDGKKYSFEYKYITVTVPVKTTRKYNRSKFVIINTETKDSCTYDSASKAASAIGVNGDDIYYRAKAANHNLGKFEIWYEDEYKASTIVPAA